MGTQSGTVQFEKTKRAHVRLQSNFKVVELLVMANNSSITSFVAAVNSPGLCFLSQPNYDPYNTTNLPDSVNAIHTVLSVVNGVASPPTVVINALIAWSVLGDEVLRSSSFNLLLVAMALTDFLVGLLTQPIFSYHQSCFVNNCYSPCTYTFYVMSVLTFIALSICTLTLVSMERYLAIEHPNFYRKVVTAKRVVLGTMIYWAVILTVVGGVVFLQTRNRTGFFKVPLPIIFVGINILIILYCSIKVQVTAYRQRRTIALQQESVQQVDEQQRQEERLKDYKRVFMMSTLVIATVLFYVPYIIVVAIERIEGKDVTDDFRYISLPICATCLNLQSLINPILVSLRLSYIRESIKNKLSFFSWNCFMSYMGRTGTRETNPKTVHNEYELKRTRTILNGDEKISGGQRE